MGRKEGCLKGLASSNGIKKGKTKGVVVGSQGRR